MAWSLSVDPPAAAGFFVPGGRDAPFLIAAALAALLVAPATAQTVCGDRAAFLERLAAVYAERPVAVGLVSNGTVLEVFASKEGSWTILVTRPNGITCVVASGEAWEFLQAELIGEGA